MATTGLSRSRTICILAVVVCCFAILWPKIFLPMLKNALSLTSSSDNEDDQSKCKCQGKVRVDSIEICGILITDEKFITVLYEIMRDPKPNKKCAHDIALLCGIDLYHGINHRNTFAYLDQIIQHKLSIITECIKNYYNDPINVNGIQTNVPLSLRSRFKDGIGQKPERVKREHGKPFQREYAKPNAKAGGGGGGGIMGFIMPIYTFAIIIFFLYTIFKLAFKKNSDEEPDSATEKPIINDYHMDPEYRKFLLNDEYDENGAPIAKRKHFRKSKNDTTINRHCTVETPVNRKCLRTINKTEGVMKNYGKDKVAKALHTLIRDMELFKAKLLEVETCKAKLAQLEAARIDAKECLRVVENEAAFMHHKLDDNIEEDENEEIGNDRESGIDEYCDNKENINETESESHIEDDDENQMKSDDDDDETETVETEEMDQRNDKEYEYKNSKNKKKQEKCKDD